MKLLDYFFVLGELLLLLLTGVQVLPLKLYKLHLQNADMLACFAGFCDIFVLRLSVCEEYRACVFDQVLLTSAFQKRELKVDKRDLILFI